MVPSSKGQVLLHCTGLSIAVFLLRAEAGKCTVQVVTVMAVQIVMAYAVKDSAWWKVMVAAYVVSGTASQNLFTAQHELSHFLAFRKPLYNKILSLASNCPLVVPMATSFRKYHQEHHSHLVCTHSLKCSMASLSGQSCQCSKMVHSWLASSIHAVMAGACVQSGCIAYLDVAVCLNFVFREP